MVLQPGNFKNQYLGNGATSESAIFTPGSGHRDLLIHVTFKSIANIWINPICRTNFSIAPRPKIYKKDKTSLKRICRGFFVCIPTWAASLFAYWTTPGIRTAPWKTLPKSNQKPLKWIRLKKSKTRKTGLKFLKLFCKLMNFQFFPKPKLVSIAQVDLKKYLRNQKKMKRWFWQIFLVFSKKTSSISNLSYETIHLWNRKCTETTFLQMRFLHYEKKNLPNFSKFGSSTVLKGVKNCPWKKLHFSNIKKLGWRKIFEIRIFLNMIKHFFFQSLFQRKFPHFANVYLWKMVTRSKKGNFDLK